MLRDLTLGLMAIAFAVGAQAAPVLLCSFEDEGYPAKLDLNVAQVALSDQHATAGQKALEISYGITDWPAVHFNAGKAYDITDWRPYGAFVFDVYNPEDKPLWLGVRVDDAPAADGSTHLRQTGVDIPARKQVTVALAIKQKVAFMNGGPPGDEPADLRADLGGGELDLGHVATFQFFLGQPKAAHKVYIDNVRLYPAKSLDGIVDRYGQYTGAEYPGKVHSDADLTARRDQEAAALRRAPRPKDRDKWGGWPQGPKLRATGWFRTEKVGGKWWLVTPDGTLFWSVGLDCVGPDNGGPTKERENLFTWLPEKGDPLYEFGGKDKGWMNWWPANLYRKYGPKWQKPWLDMTRERMAAWGFNTVANWSWDESYRQLKVPFCAPIHYGAPGFSGMWNWVSDPYEPGWATAVEAAVKGVTDKWRDNPYCIGYFVDNEIAWGGWGEGDRYALVTCVLGLKGDHKAKLAFAELLKAKYKDIAALNAAWKTNVESWEKLAAEPVTLPSGPPQGVYRADLAMLLTDFATKYFSTVHELMRKYAPNQLYLGSRFASAPDEVAFVAKDYCDVVTYNIYSRAPGLIQRGAQAGKLDKPVLVGEFHFGALDRGMFHTGLGPVASQEGRGVQYAEYVKAALDQPWCVGTHWFTYGDEALTGRSDGENYNIGFVNTTDTTYPELVAHATKVNMTIYERRGKR